jgi:alpha/beta superfamily hydrolase
MGGTMANPTVVRTARALAAAGCPALRFNFRGVGKSAGAYSGGAEEPEDIGAAVTAMAEAFPDLPVWLVGYSFGAIMGSRWVPTDERVRAFVAIGFPLMMGYQLPHLGDRPLLCIQGERDRFGDGASIAMAAEDATPIQKTIIIPGAEHLFVGKTQDVGDAVAAEIDWLANPTS